MVATDEEQARFRHVVLPYLGDCYALARWLTGDRADAEDVVQEACVRALRAIGGFAGTNARAWTLTIVRHTAYSWLRKNRSNALVVVDDLEAVEHARAEAGDGGAAIRKPPSSPRPKRRGWSARSQSCRFRFGKRWCCATCRASAIATSPRSRACRSAPSCRGLRAPATV